MDEWEKIRKKHEKEAARRAAKDRKDLEKFQPKFPVPEGFTGDWVTDRLYSGDKNWVLTCDEKKVRFIFRPGGPGTCEFQREGRDGKTYWSNFDRTGVSDSFYWKSWNGDKLSASLEADLKGLIARVEKTREYDKTSIPVPGIGFTVSPERKATVTRDLVRVGYVQFYPSGFGIGHTFTVKRPRGHGERATKEQEQFFGHSPLWHYTMDCD